MLKRIISVSLAAIIIIALVGCGARKREVVNLTLSTEDAEAILNAAGIYLPDPETAAGANTVAQLYGYRNDLQNYSEEEMVQTGYWTFKERYGCDIEYVECVFADRWTTLANLMLSDNTPDFYAAWATDSPCYCLQGMFQPIDDYMSYDDPLWADMKYMAACDRFKTVDPTVVNIDRRQLKEKKGWTEEMLDMWDTMYEIAHSHNTLVMFENGLGDAAPIVDNLFNYTRQGGDTSWAKRKEQYSDQLQYYLDDLNSQIDELEKNPDQLG